MEALIQLQIFMNIFLLDPGDDVIFPFWVIGLLQSEESWINLDLSFDGSDFDI